MANFEGKVAFITGGGSGIGRGIALRLAQDGADVCVSDMDLDGAEETGELVRKIGSKALVVRANVASEPQVRDAISACVSGLGRLDFAVANAGIARGGSILELSLKDWQDQLDVNLTGVFLTVQAAARRMVELGHGGRIVCMASLAAANTGASIWGYSATKAGVRIMVRGWAQELGPHAITVNAIGPGIIDTPLAHGLAGDEGGAIRASVEQRTPIGRVGKPEDIGGLVAFLCGPDGEFMTGSYLIMDGGLRDARMQPDPDPSDPRVQEMQQHLQSAMERGQRLQRLLDER
ncbi:MAG: SDR family oxidoreductase [Myxococcota bacterium]|nr:SDR family oxidoreductase [Myxococcota bacterium]